mmetsp:Transcript_151/g.454  ORF Transcript_151/g.454 Transcript_151/m.454 type:complete len:711 (-) Transcript_151:73-2205(-)|eukprot:CAMPEP_0170151314 /NCGR_PEP_ID=MMETSP0033_2-20121228/49217_1 /TAXON_ID=195969 /ORGANISM="Dolichomastix tenuilepis, Strain CCMP3274" /LENGTH=710 /DNA_ID=CAMNT_0010388409 /DNA_START=49 /DNA_END=2181 /DNA_ORIENTATION=+
MSSPKEDKLARFRHAARAADKAVKMVDALDAFGAYGADFKASREHLIEAAKRIKDEDDLRRSDERKAKVMNILLLVLFCDAMGAFLMVPVTPRIYNFAPEGASQREIDGGMGVFAQEASDFPLGGLAAAMQYGQITTMLATSVANSFSSQLASMVGRKGAFYTYTFGGALMYALSGLAGDLQMSMYTYWGARALMGLFAGSQPQVTAYITEMYKDAPPEVRQKKLMLPMASMVAACLVGPLVGMAVIASQRFFVPLYIGALLELCAGVLVVLQVPDLPIAKQQDAAAAKKTDEEDSDGNEVPATKPGFFKWVMLFWAARFCDRTATGQFQYLQTKGVELYGDEAIVMLPVVIVILSIVGVVSIPMSMTKSREYGLAWTCIFGQGLAAVCFVLLAIVASTEFGGFWMYVLVVILLQTFSGVAAVLVNPTIDALVPPARKNAWIAYQAGYSQVTSALCPLIIIPFLSGELDGDIETGTYLMVNGVICAASVLLYLPLIKKFPWPKVETMLSAQEVEAMKYFEDTGDASLLSWEQLGSVLRVNAKEGRPLTRVPFGQVGTETWADELARLQSAPGNRDLQAQFDKTGEFLSDWRTKPDEREAKKVSLRALADTEWSDEIRDEFGRWVAGYLELHGYLRPDLATNLYKAMIVKAFPPMMENKSGWAQVAEDPIPHFTKINRHAGTFLVLDYWHKSEQKAFSRFQLATLRITGTS